jgi:Nucleotidyltransferase domain
MPNFRAFITGSHAYGIPHKDSDVDLVVFVTTEHLRKLQKAAELTASATRLLQQLVAAGQPIEDTPENHGYDPDDATCLYFGRLNLICCTEEMQYEAWRRGTRELKAKAPVPREFACAYFDKLRKEMGIKQCHTNFI